MTDQISPFYDTGPIQEEIGRGLFYGADKDDTRHRALDSIKGYLGKLNGADSQVGATSTIPVSKVLVFGTHKIGKTSVICQAVGRIGENNQLILLHIGHDSANVSIKRGIDILIDSAQDKLDESSHKLLNNIRDTAMQEDSDFSELLGCLTECLRITQKGATKPKPIVIVHEPVRDNHSYGNEIIISQLKAVGTSSFLVFLEYPIENVVPRDLREPTPRPFYDPPISVEKLYIRPLDYESAKALVCGQHPRCLTNRCRKPRYVTNGMVDNDHADLLLSHVGCHPFLLQIISNRLDKNALSSREQPGRPIRIAIQDESKRLKENIQILIEVLRLEQDDAWLDGLYWWAKNDWQPNESTCLGLEKHGLAYSYRVTGTSHDEEDLWVLPSEIKKYVRNMPWTAKDGGMDGIGESHSPLDPLKLRVALDVILWLWPACVPDSKERHAIAENHLDKELIALIQQLIRRIRPIDETQAKELDNDLGNNKQLLNQLLQEKITARELEALMETIRMSLQKLLRSTDFTFPDLMDEIVPNLRYSPDRFSSQMSQPELANALVVQVWADNRVLKLIREIRGMKPHLDKWVSDVSEETDVGQYRHIE